MGNTGSYTTKATIHQTLFPFTTWLNKEISEFLLRGQQELSETFALRKVEFDFLIGNRRYIGDLLITSNDRD